MPRTIINCPNCRQPIQAEIRQLFDVGADPTAKQIFLSGSFNLARCPHCGFQGNLATPLVYHDPSKQLLITFIPPEVGLQRNDQERVIGSMINQVVNNLPQENRKAYLLQPQTALTLQGMIERVLEADGITREMIQAQEQRISLLQRLANASEDVRNEIIFKEDNLIDADFFNVLNHLIEASAAGGDQESAGRLRDLRGALLQSSSFGKKLQEQTAEIEAAIRSLREAGDALTREKLLDLILHAPNDTRLSALVSLARPGLDYVFFQMLSERIDRARGDGRARMIELRERLLELTREIDQQTEIRLKAARQLLEKIIQSEDSGEATLKMLPAIDELFLHELEAAMNAAKKEGNLEILAKLQTVTDVLNKASAPPPELALIEELLAAPDELSRRQLLESNRDKITHDFLNVLANIVAQVEGGEDKELAERLRELHRMALRMSMEVSFRGN